MDAPYNQAASRQGNRELVALLWRMSGSAYVDYDVERAIEKLSEIYSGGFRHDYSEIGDFVRAAFGPQTGETRHAHGFRRADPDLLLDNLQSIEDGLQVGSYGDPSLSIAVHKLVDHVKLELQRIGDVRWLAEMKDSVGELSHETSESGKKLEGLSGKLDDGLKKAEKAAKDIADVEGKLASASKDIDAVAAKANSMMGETIAVLGIFSAIVMTFNGAVSFSTSALSQAGGGDVFSIGLIVSLVGLVLFDTVFGMLSFVYRLVKFELRRDRRPDASGKPADSWFGSHKTMFIVGNVAFSLLIVLFVVLVCCQRSGAAAVSSATGA